ncbi:glycosyltransferase family 61 protein [Pseudogemmobacter sonorensis]|uniref:glycosyltransferase family 61 protein n=1 Tax=Pseudogemmobacter sonorensis TaxID=2989681 RepID=UPI0036BC1577
MARHPVDEGRFLPRIAGLAGRLARGESCGDGQDLLETEGWFAGYPVGPLRLVVLRGALWHRDTGLVMTRDGRLPAAPAAEIPPPALARSRRMLHRLRPRRMGRGALWLPMGAQANYGHFLFDALPGLTALEETGLSSLYPPVSPALRPWQAALARLAGLEHRLRFPPDPVIEFDQLVYATTLDHYLQRSGALLLRSFARLGGRRPSLSGAPLSGAGESLYLSRRGRSARIFLDEAALERGLAARGVRVIDPGRMEPAEQIAAFGRARVVIAASGAALANIPFLPEGARVVEIRPPGMEGAWTGLTAARFGLDHVIVSAEGLPPGALPLAARIAQLPRRLAGRYHTAFVADPEAIAAAAFDPAAPGREA